MKRERYLFELWKEWRELRHRLKTVEAEITRMQSSDAMPPIFTRTEDVPEWLKLKTRQ